MSDDDKDAKKARVISWEPRTGTGQPKGLHKFSPNDDAPHWRSHQGDQQQEPADRPDDSHRNP